MMLCQIHPFCRRFCRSQRWFVNCSRANVLMSSMFNVRLGQAKISNSTKAHVLNTDTLQLQLLKEPCIIVDEDDNVLGTKSKKDCHLLSDNSKGILHRAFSVFLFNSNGHLLMQQRSMAKITFPGYFTNSCCSHPLYVPEEMEIQNAVGVKRAAQRRLKMELGIPEIPLERFHYLTRIHYCSQYNDHWGEHEIDYILIVKADVTTNINSNEVLQLCYVSQEEFPSFIGNLQERNIPITPWFQLIMSNFLQHWWTNLSDIEHIESKATIHRL